MDVPWSSRLFGVSTKALPGLLHEFSSPLAILSNDSQFLDLETKARRTDWGEDLSEVAAEMEAATRRLADLLTALKGAPLGSDTGKPFGPVCNSVLTLLHNHWKYAWKVEAAADETPNLPCPEGWAWVAWAEGLQTLTEALPGGTLVLTGRAAQGLEVRVLPAPGSGVAAWDTFRSRWEALVTQGPLVGAWQPEEAGWRALVWFQAVAL